MESAFFTHSIVRIGGIIFSLLFLNSPAFADVSISINPIEGGSSLNFGAVNWSKNNDKQVNIRVNSSSGEPYQVYQRLSAPLVNDRGYSLNRSALQTGALTGSNAYGSLYLQGPEYLGYVDQLIYSSDQSGHSDSVTAFYRANLEEIKEPGNYFGNIIFTVRPLGGAAQAQALLKIYLESAPESHIETNASHGKDSVYLKTEGPGQQGGYFSMTFKDLSDSGLSITQELIEPLHNDRNEILDSKRITFSTSGECQEQDYPSLVSLEQERKTICRDRDAQGDLTVHFQLDPKADEEKAGTYRGRLKYSLQSGSLSQDYEVELQVEIMPNFKMDLAYPSGNMSFNRLIPKDPPQTREVIVNVHTNLGRPYSVTQSMASPMTNEKGELFDSKHFVFKQELIDASPGKVSATDFQPVEPKNTTIFYSDNAGDPAQFRVIYRLSPFEGMDPGKYGTSITYSLGEN